MGKQEKISGGYAQGHSNTSLPFSSTKTYGQSSTTNVKSSPTTNDPLLIPSFAGARKTAYQYQRRTQVQYLALASLGLLTFYKSTSSRLRIAGLSCIFPGAGFLGIGGTSGAIGFVISVAMIPLSLFAWFGAGGLAFVIANWILPGIVAFSICGTYVWELSAPVAVCIVLALITYVITQANLEDARKQKKRGIRNAILEKEFAEWSQRVDALFDPDEKRELNSEFIRTMQYFVELALQDFGDWTNFTQIDQFQTAAFRYQLYEISWQIAYIQKFYMPSFHGYVKTTQERCIEKSLSEDVLGYWKWESLWGKFTLDWDPVKRDNIMVTGYLLIVLSLYEKLNGDYRYDAEGALNMRVTKNKTYRHNTRSVFEAVISNWNGSSYTLYPCEPSWIYSACNLQAMQGALSYDAYKKTGRVAPLLDSRYRQAFEEEFVNPDGSVVALRSSITGFHIPGLAGVLGDVGAANLCLASMPNLARRLWLVSREGHVKKDENGKSNLVNLVGADNIDVGNYKPSEGLCRILFSLCAVTMGESALAAELLEVVDKEQYPLVPTTSGSLYRKNLSILGQSFAFRSKMQRRGDWEHLINSGRDERVLLGPKLDSIPFPDVMVARCFLNETGDGLEFVLHSFKVGNIVIGFKDLKKSMSFILEKVVDGKSEVIVKDIRADAEGRAEVQVDIEGRTELNLRTEV